MKKLISILLAAVMVTGMCSCAKKASTESDGTTKLTWYVNSDPMDDLDAVMDKVNEITKEKLNVTIDMKFIDDGAYTERMRMYMASGKDFDLCFAGYALPYVTGVNNGGLLALDELIDTEAPELREIIPDYAFETAKVKGKIYGVPNMQAMALTPCAYIDEKVAQKYGLDKIDKIDNLDELEPYFDKIKQDFPGVYPVESISTYDIMKNYEYINDYAYIDKKDPNNKIVLIYDTPEFTKSMERAARWYQKGYVRSDIATVNSLTEDRKAGKYAVTFGSYTPGCEKRYESEFGIKTHVIKYVDTYMNTYQMLAAMTGINAKTKHPVEAIKLLSLINSDSELMNLLTYGIEGKHYEKIDDKTIRLLDSKSYSLNGWKVGNSFLTYITEGQPENTQEESQKLNEEAIKPIAMGFNVETQPIKNEIAQCDAIRKECESNILNGTVDYKTAFPEYMSRLESVGVRNIITEVQRQFDEWKASK